MANQGFAGVPRTGGDEPEGFGANVELFYLSGLQLRVWNALARFAAVELVG